jgi:hypothetical protein
VLILQQALVFQRLDVEESTLTCVSLRLIALTVKNNAGMELAHEMPRHLWQSVTADVR